MADQDKESSNDGSAHEQQSAEGPTLSVGTEAVTAVGAGVGRNKQTSGIWKLVVEFAPPKKGMNVKCVVKTKLPAAGRLPEREVVCGHLMKYQRAVNGKKGSGTNGLWNHIKKSHPGEHAAEMLLSSHSTEGKKRKSQLFGGERWARRDHRH